VAEGLLHVDDQQGGFHGGSVGVVEALIMPMAGADVCSSPDRNRSFQDMAIVHQAPMMIAMDRELSDTSIPGCVPETAKARCRAFLGTKRGGFSSP
jgi:hypothetical protein